MPILHNILRPNNSQSDAWTFDYNPSAQMKDDTGMTGIEVAFNPVGFAVAVGIMFSTEAEAVKFCGDGASIVIGGLEIGPFTNTAELAGVAANFSEAAYHAMTGTYLAGRSIIVKEGNL